MLDARGYVCPMPVVMVQKEVKASAPELLEVLVDDPCAVENITRYGSSCGYTTEAVREGRDFRLVLRK